MTRYLRTYTITPRMTWVIGRRCYSCDTVLTPGDRVLAKRRSRPTAHTPTKRGDRTAYYCPPCARIYQVA